MAGGAVVQHRVLALVYVVHLGFLGRPILSLLGQANEINHNNTRASRQVDARDVQE